MEKFNVLYDGMSKNYSYLEQIMGVLFEQIKVNPDSEKKEILLGLNELAKGMLQSQKEFALAYCPEESYLLGQLEGKEKALQEALDSLENNTISK